MEYSLWEIGISWLVMILMGICYGFCTPLFSFGKIIPPVLPNVGDIDRIIADENARSYDCKDIWVAYNKLENSVKNIESYSGRSADFPLTRFIWIPMVILFVQTSRHSLVGIYFGLYIASLILVFVVSIIVSKKVLHVNYYEDRIYFDGRTFEGEKIELPWKRETCTIKELKEYLEFPIFYLAVGNREGETAHRESRCDLAATGMVAIFTFVSFAIRGVL